MKNNAKYQWLYVLTMSLMLFGAEAAQANNNQSNPLGCRDTGYQFEFKTLNLYPEEAGSRNSLYFLLNKSEQKINLFQMIPDNSTLSMYLNHRIGSDRWGVLSTCEKEIKYICTVDDPKSRYGKIVDCGKYLQVCEFARVRFGLNNRGNYWIVNSNTKNGAVRQVVNYGIIPQ
jgi:hypothetical protein